MSSNGLWGEKQGCLCWEDFLGFLCWEADSFCLEFAQPSVYRTLEYRGEGSITWLIVSISYLLYPAVRTLMARTHPTPHYPHLYTSTLSLTVSWWKKKASLQFLSLRFTGFGCCRDFSHSGVSPRTGHPVRCMLDRDEDMLITGGRHPFLARYKVLDVRGCAGCAVSSA